MITAFDVGSTWNTRVRRVGDDECSLTTPVVMADSLAMRAASEYEEERRTLEQEAVDRLDEFVKGTAKRDEVRRKLEALTRELRTCRKSIVLAQKQLHAQFRESMGRAATRSYPFRTGFQGRAAAGRARADAKRKVTRTKYETIHPYDRVKLEIDKLIDWIEQQRQTIAEGGSPELNPPQPEPEAEPHPVTSALRPLSLQLFFSL